MTELELTSDRVFGIPVPLRVGRCERLHAHNNEATNPGLGVTVGYRAAEVEMTVYAYDLGIEALEDGALTERNKQHYLQCIHDVFESSAVLSQRVTLLGRHLRGSNFIGPEFLRASFIVEDEHGPQLSVLLVTCYAQRFVKLRVSSRLAPEEALAAIEQVCDDYSTLLWPHRSSTRLIVIGRPEGS